jgi:Fic family protein
MDFAKKLQFIQKQNDKTQTELAAVFGVSFPTLNSWILGKSVPRKGAQAQIDALYVEYFGDVKAISFSAEKEIARLKSWQEKYKNPLSFITSQKDIYDSFVLFMTYHTNSIEGSTFSEPEVRAVLFDDVTIPNKTVQEHQEAKNHQAALGFVMRCLRDDKKAITASLIKKIHFILMNGILHNAGQFRTHRVRIVGSHVTTSNPARIYSDMNEFVKKLTRKLPKEDVVAHIAYTHAMFEQIHPFSDGNGRVGRLIMLILALQNNLAPILIQKEKKLAYYKYLQEAQLKGNYTPLIAFMYDALFEGYNLLDR